ncbi:MAG: aminotransferase class I/II-fold pyridoxal phosphate-dependent enzyme [Eubacteriales bacterium]|nr:aminotransferase class I/II-fold pyridoxal phosphate-dependent enzyme [Eubacteriales bacterium]
MIRHGGDIYRNRVQLDISVNCNPLGLPIAVKRAAEASISDCEAYPDARCESLRLALAQSQRLPAAWYVFGNGAASLLYQSLQALRPKRVLLPAPGFVEYERAAESVGAVCTFFDSLAQPYYTEAVVTDGTKRDTKRYINRYTKRDTTLPTLEEALTEDIDLVFLCSPNNPTGQLVNGGDLTELLERLSNRHTVLLLDECFMDLVEPEQAARHSLLAQWQMKRMSLSQRVILLKAFTKTYAMPGLRLGYAVVPDSALRESLLGQQPTWEVSIPAQAAGLAAIAQTSYLEEARRLIAGERERLVRALCSLGLTVVPSEANFLLFHSPLPLYRRLLEQGILIRDCSDYHGLTEGWYRLCVSLPEKNEIVIQALEDIFRKQNCDTTTEESNG